MATRPVSPDRILDAVKEGMFGLSDIGFCTKCGAEHYGVEPDARKYPCEECGTREVFGAQELLLMGWAE